MVNRVKTATTRHSKFATALQKFLQVRRKPAFFGCITHVRTVTTPQPTTGVPFMSAKSIIAGGFLALAALVASTSTAQAQFIGTRSVTVATGYRAPIYQNYSYGAYGTPLVTSSYFPQPVPYYQQPVIVSGFYNNVYGGGYGGGYGHHHGYGYGGGYSPYYGGGFGRPGVNLGFNFNFR
jgi:hypothetical protein